MTKEEQQKTPAVLQVQALNTNNPNKINYSTANATYYIKGGIRKDLDSLKVTLVVEHPETKSKSRNKLDLYEDKQTEKIARESAEKLGLRSDLIENDLNHLTDLHDEYRESQLVNTTEEKIKKVILSSEEQSKCIAFLKQDDLLIKINALIGKSGVVGEENSRIFLFGITSSYKMQETLHGLIQGSSGSGKTHLLASIMDFIPEEDRMDESNEQTLRIIRYQNNKAAGIINKKEEREIRAFLVNCIRLIKPYEVVNPYANKIELPREAHKIRRLNDLFQSYVKQVTILNQYPRRASDAGLVLWLWTAQIRRRKVGLEGCTF